ncbi:MAG: FtsX-like permease family protein [Bacteroidia bacterium]
MNVSLYIARRYFIAKKSTNAITVISWISVLAITVGTGALIIILSGMNGLTGLVETMYNSFNPDVKITAVQGKTFSADKDFISSLEKINGVAFVSKSLEDNMLLKYEDKLQIVKVKGVDKNFVPATHFDTLVKEGRFLNPASKQREMVLGKGIAFRLGISLNDMFTPITILNPKKGNNNSINPEDAFNEDKCYPSGFFAINDDFDFSYALVDYSTAKNLLDCDSSTASSVEIALKPEANVKNAKEEIQKLLGAKFKVQDKFEQTDVLFKTLQTEKLVVFLILAFVLLIATFNIIGTLTMLIIEKKKDIKVLSSLGADVSLIRKIFMAEGLMIIFIGSVIGISLGYIMCLLQQHFGFIKFDEGYQIDAYPVDMRLTDFLAVVGTVLLTGFIAAIYPVRVFTKQHLVAED